MLQWRKIGILALVLQVALLVQCDCGVKDTTNTWKEMSYYSPLPNNAIAAGLDAEGTQIFIARAVHKNSVYSARYSLTDGQAFVADNGEEHPKREYDVLIGNGNNYLWVNSNNGFRVINAVPAGTDYKNEPTYICRGFGIGGVLLGHLEYSHKKCIVSDAGLVLELNGYQVLTKR